MNKNPSDGFSLVELMIYFAVFSVAASFLVGILVTTTKVSLKSGSTDDLDQEISFVGGVIQRAIRNSSLIENPLGVASTSLALRMSVSSLDPTRIYVDAASTGVYMAEGSSNPVRLTSDKVKVNSFSITKYQNSGSFSLVQVNLTLDASTTKQEARASKAWRSGIARISAATFDSNLLASSTSYTLGQAGTPWDKVFVSDGSSANPSYTFSGDTSLGLFRSAASILGFGAGGSESARIDASNSGNVTLKIGSSLRAGCIELGDSDGSGITYVSANNGVVTSSAVKPAFCQ